MRPVGKRRLLRSEVAAKPTPVLRVPVSNLLLPTGQRNELTDYLQTAGTSMRRVMVPADWDESAGRGGVGGRRNQSLAPEPFSGAA